MKTELKQKWLAALRSGEYRQGMRNLKYNQEGEVYHCCLGVLAEMADPKSLQRDEFVDEVFMYQKSSWVGLYRIEGAEEIFDYLSEDMQKILWRMNDVEKESFPEIADWIEANVPEDNE
jgi:hypothetical protein